MGEFIEKTFKFDEYDVTVKAFGLWYTVKLENGSTETYPLLSLRCSVDKVEDGGGIRIHFIDRWGSQMLFTHYEPSDLKGMFDFIARGYRLKFIK